MKANGKKQAKREVAETQLLPDDVNEKVAQRAYQLFERRGGELGHEMEDWLEAERSVREEASQTA